MAASDSSCSICYSAKGFKLTEETEKNFFTQVRSYWGDHSFPDLEDESAQWAVNVAVPSASFKHHSLIFRNLKTGEHFRVELIVYRNQVYPKTSYFNPKSKDLPPLEYKNFGSCSGSARSLFRFCLQKLQSLGDYQGAFRNCQDYCQVSVITASGLSIKLMA